MWNLLWLPPEQSNFEREHLSRVNRVALAFFAANVPLMVGVAAANGTGPALAGLLATLVLAGPLLAWAGLSNLRHVSVVQGIAAMCMGGLLVHFGQGPMQIEMHFYFFSILAVLALFANPMVIVAAAVTVTLHHTVVWLLLPRSVFNYDASLFVVAVHAAFVVVESIAAIYLARSFFDSVIGMEKIVERRTEELRLANRSMRLVLQHVNQGLLTIDRSGQLAKERSAKVDELLGPAPTTMRIDDYLRSVDPAVADWFALGWEDLISGIMPVEVTLEQLPRSLSTEGRHLGLEYIPIPGNSEDEGIGQVLVVVSDRTQQIRHQQAEALRQEQLALFHHHRRDPDGLALFVRDASALVAGLSERSWGDVATCRRWLHTLKGNALSMDLKAFGAAIHALEDASLAEEREPSRSEVAAIAEQWSVIADAVATFGGRSSGDLLVTPERIRKLEAAVQADGTPAEVVTMVRELTWRPAAHRLAALGAQATALAERLGEVTVDGGEVFLASGELDALWGPLTHLIRNAVDHGIEAPDTRIEQEKSPKGALTLRCVETGGALHIEVADDGAGVDWDRVQAKAEAIGLPNDTEADRVAALFADGLSTAEVVTDTSGRGVGMSALKQVVDDLGGTITLHSVRGVGTTWTVRVPRRQAEAA